MSVTKSCKDLTSLFTSESCYSNYNDLKIQRESSKLLFIFKKSQMPVRPIDPSIHKQITSSSSIDSPLAAIKELLDNSIDATGTTSIQIEIDKATGGLGRIEVKDNGCGIQADDRPLVCLKSYTSKITKIEDLQTITSLGFRGEALNNIANLSKGDLHITTRCRGEATGVQWSVDENGFPLKDDKGEIAFTKIAASVGTTIIVSKLFANYSVRRKILTKTKAQLIKATESLIKSYSVIHHHIRFELKFSDNTTGTSLCLLPTKSNKDSFQSLYLKKSIHLETISISVDDLTLNLNYTTSSDSPSRKQTFINKRLLNNSIGFAKACMKSINGAFDDLGLNRPQSWLLEVYIKTNLNVDVNIEPKKDDLLINKEILILARFRICLRDRLKTVKLTGGNIKSQEVSHSNTKPQRESKLTGISKQSLKTNTDIKDTKDRLLTISPPLIPVAANYIHEVPSIMLNTTKTGNDFNNGLSNTDDLFNQFLDAKIANTQSSKTTISWTSQNKFQELDHPITRLPTEQSTKQWQVLKVDEGEDSEGEGDWTMSIYGRLSSRANSDSFKNSIVPNLSSDEEDDDLKVSKIIELSNPFTLAKLISKKKSLEETPSFFNLTVSSPNHDVHLPSPESSFMTSFKTPIRRKRHPLGNPSGPTSTPKRRIVDDDFSPNNQIIMDHKQSKLDKFLINTNKRIYRIDNDMNCIPIQPQRVPKKTFQIAKPKLSDTPSSSIGGILKSYKRIRLPVDSGLFRYRQFLKINTEKLYFEGFQEIEKHWDHDMINGNLSSFIQSLHDDLTFVLHENDDFFYITLDENYEQSFD